MSELAFRCWWCGRDGPPSPEPSLAYRWCATCQPGAEFWATTRPAYLSAPIPEPEPVLQAVLRTREASGVVVRNRTLARATEARLLAHLLLHGPAIAADLAGSLGLPRETMRDRLRSLQAAGLVETTAEPMPQGGTRFRYDLTAAGGERVAA